MPNSSKLCPIHISRGGEKFYTGGIRPPAHPGYGPAAGYGHLPTYSLSVGIRDDSLKVELLIWVEIAV